MDIICYNEGMAYQNLPIEDFNEDDIDVRKNSAGSLEYTILFTGVQLLPNKAIVVFPKFFDSNNKYKDINTLLSVLSKHQIRNRKEYLNNNIKFDSNFPFNEFYNIYFYFRTYGLFRESINITQTNSGDRINWKHSFRNSQKIISGNNIIYSPLYYKNSRLNENVITRTMEFCINYTLSLTFGILAVEPVNDGYVDLSILKHKDTYIKILLEIREKTFNDKTLSLIDNIILFLKSNLSGGHLSVKHFNFENVWEEMVNLYLNNYFEHGNLNGVSFSDTRMTRALFSKKRFYVNNLKNDHYIQPDHFAIIENITYVLDSKYKTDHEYIDYKQIVYYYFLSEIESDEVKPIFNYLIHPANDYKVRRIFELNKNFIKTPIDAKIHLFSLHLPIKDVMENYLK